MAETAGLIFYFKWEMELMEWLQAHIGSNSCFLKSIFSKEPNCSPTLKMLLLSLNLLTVRVVVKHPIPSLTASS